MHVQTIRAILKRDFKSYFGSVTGYVFVLAFVLVCVVLAFRPGRFFLQNEANLNLLTEWFPLVLVLFAPALTMRSWASERQEETDSLLLTLPAYDWEIVLGKFGACFSVYSVALGFTLVFVGALEYIGDPDLGLMFGTYLGYWLLGALAVATGMLGSSLHKNTTVAWILGALLCAHWAALPGLLSYVGTGSFIEAFMDLEVRARFASFPKGVAALDDILYFSGMTLAVLYANALLLGMRHWTTRKGRMIHGALRLASLGVATSCLVLLAGTAALRLDVTEERMLSLTPEAEAVIDALPEGNPVHVQAWVSKDMPESYKATRDALVNMLQEFDAQGGERLQVAIHETELFSNTAREAEEAWGIRPQRVEDVTRGKRSVEEIFLGLVLTCGAQEITIPFFDRGLPIQYELTRAIGSVAQQDKSKIGILASGADLFGGFDFQTMNRSTDWQILGDLRKQYDVQKVDGANAIGADLSVLVVPLPSSLPQPAMNKLAKHLYDGGKALILCDPYPEFDRNLAPTRPADSNKNPFQQQRGPPKPPKGNVEQLFHSMGVAWQKNRITWDDHNPHPEWTIPRELVFVAPATKGRPSGFNEEDPVTSGLQELAMIFPGELDWDRSNADIEVTPLLWTGGKAGYHTWREMVQETFFGIQPTPDEARVYESFVDVSITAAGPKAQDVIDAISALPGRANLPQEVSLDALPVTVASGLTRAQAQVARTKLEDAGASIEFVPTRRVLALRIKGKLRAAVAEEGMTPGTLSPNTFEAIVVADMDMVSDVFYSLRAQGTVDLNLDNVTFVANCIDSLAGEHSYITLRKLRPKHRTLTKYEEIEEEFKAAQRQAEQVAREESERKLKEAKARLDAKLREIEQRTDLDARTKQMMYEAASQTENRRYELAEVGVKDEERAKNRASRTDMEQKSTAAKNRLRARVFGVSMALPMLLGCFVLGRKFLTERASVEQGRRRSS